MLRAFDNCRLLQNISGGFIDQLRNGLALEAFAIVNRDQVAAPCTPVFPVLFFDKLTDSLVPDKLQVILHAHFVVLAVAFFDALNLRTGILLAFVAKSGVPANCIVIDAGAFAEQVSAFPASGTATDTLAAFQVIDLRQVIAADGAIHPARSDQV